MSNKTREIQGEFIKAKSEIVTSGHQDVTILPQNVNQPVPHFSKDEMVLLLSKLPPDKYGMLFQFLWRTGVRVSEALQLRKGDIHFDNDELQIRWLKSRKYMYRNIPLHTTLKMPLYSFTANLKTDARVFSYTRQYIHYLCQKHGFGNPHKIRHSFAVNFLRQSDSPMALVELKELLGHSNIRTTMIYLQVVPMSQKKAMERISFD